MIQKRLATAAKTTVESAQAECHFKDKNDFPNDYPECQFFVQV